MSDIEKELKKVSELLAKAITSHERTLRRLKYIKGKLSELLEELEEGSYEEEIEEEYYEE